MCVYVCEGVCALTRLCTSESTRHTLELAIIVLFVHIKQFSFSKFQLYLSRTFITWHEYYLSKIGMNMTWPRVLYSIQSGGRISCVCVFASIQLYSTRSQNTKYLYVAAALLLHHAHNTHKNVFTLFCFIVPSVCVWTTYGTTNGTVFALFGYVLPKHQNSTVNRSLSVQRPI